jgi:ATP-binding cassette subfamily C protein
VTGSTAVVPPSAELGGERLISDFCQKNGLVWRYVTLTAGWQRNDAGPLLVFSGETRNPYILLWKQYRQIKQYYAISPLDSKAFYVNPKDPDHFLPYAVSFYPTLRTSSFRLKDILPLVSNTVSDGLPLALLISVAIAIIGLLPSFLLSQVISNAIPDASTVLLLQYTALLLAALLTSNLLNLVRNRLLLKLQGQLALRIGAALWDRLLRLPIPHLSKFTAAELTQRSEGILSIQNVLSGQSTVITIDGVLASLNILLMLYFSPSLTLIAVSVCVLLIVMSVVLVRMSLSLLYSRSALSARVIGLTQSLLSIVDTLRVSSSEINGVRQWARLFSVQQSYDLKIAKLGEVSAVTGKAVGLILSLVILIYAATISYGQPQSVQLPLASLLGFNAALGVFLGSALQLTSVLTSQQQQIRFLWDRIKPVVDHPIESGHDRLTLSAAADSIQIKDLHFTYSSSVRPVLKGIDLDIRPGQHVALVGSSGSGKSTLVRLLLGFEYPTSGFIGFNGISAKRLDPVQLRRSIGIVLQDIELLSGTILTNISTGRSLTDEQVWAALEKAAMADQVAAMPLKLNTPVISGGLNLSGGERQRIMLARALAQDPSILIMDEATSALDNASQSVVQHSISSLNCTRITIAHRLSTIASADRIVMLENGLVVEDGSFDTLVGKQGSFFQLFKSQLTF